MGKLAPDVLVVDHGSIVTFYPRSQAAQDWWKDHVDPDAQTLGRNFVVEHRYAPDIIAGLERDGFIIS